MKRFVIEEADSSFLSSGNVQRFVEHEATCVALEMVLFVHSICLLSENFLITTSPMAESWPCGPCFPE